MFFLVRKFSSFEENNFFRASTWKNCWSYKLKISFLSSNLSEYQQENCLSFSYFQVSQTRKKFFFINFFELLAWNVFHCSFFSLGLDIFWLTLFLECILKLIIEMSVSLKQIAVNAEVKKRWYIWKKKNQFSMYCWKIFEYLMFFWLSFPVSTVKTLYIFRVLLFSIKSSLN